MTTSNGNERSLKKAVNAASEKPLKPAVIIKAKKLAEAGTTGTVAKGVYEGFVADKYNPNKRDYKIRGEEEFYIVKETQELRKLMDVLEQEGLENPTIRIVYNGRKTSKGGRSFHDWDVLLVDTKK